MSPLRRPPPHSGGFTLIEVIATLVVLLLGVAAVSALTIDSARQTRRALSATQAETLAAEQLESLRNVGCTTATCDNLVLAVPTAYSVYWSANGVPSRSAPSPAEGPVREYHVSVDVDPPFEGDELGEPSLAGACIPGSARGCVVNVRVTVGWDDESGRQAVALQTRLAP